MICMTLDCVGLMQSSIIRIIHHNVDLKGFFHLPKCLLLSLVFTYIYISQDSVKAHLLRVGIKSNHLASKYLCYLLTKLIRCLLN